MAVTHVLRDGTVLKEITGHIVKMEEAKAIYNLIESLNKRKEVKKCSTN